MPPPCIGGPPLPGGWVVRRYSCRFPRALESRLCHKLIPAPPERAHLQFVGDRRMLALHSARYVRPSYFSIGEPTLTRFEHLDVVRSGESSRPEERQKVVEPQRRVLRALIGRRQGPRIHLHVVGRNGIEGANRDRHDVVDYQVRKNPEIAARLAYAPRPLRPKAFIEAAPHFLEMRLAMLAERRDPVRDRPSPRALVFHYRVTVAEIDCLLMRRCRDIAASQVDTYVT